MRSRASSTKLEKRALVVRLAEEKFLCVGIGCLVGKIDRGIFVCFAAFLFGASDSAHQFLSPG